jgi:hypothetical protein
MKLRIDPERGLQDAELNQLADLLSAHCVCTDEEHRDWVREWNRRQLEILRGCLLTPEGVIQVDDESVRGKRQ